MLTQTLQGALQAQIRSATGKTNQDFNGDLHDLCDIYALPAAPISGRIIGLANKFDTSINSSSAAMNYLLANSSLVVGPAGLFATGAQGVWYDPSDASTLFEDTAGTTPSPTPGAGALSVVGRMLDKSGNGNHAISYNTTTARPELSARVNLLTYSQEIGGTNWTSFNGTSTINNLVAPDGTTTATLFTENTSNSQHAVYGTNMTLTAAVHTCSVYIKGGTRRYVSMRTENTASGYAWVTLDTQTGAVNSNAAVTSSSATSVGNGWYRVTVTFANTTVGAGNIVLSGSDIATAPGTAIVFGNTYTGTSGTFYVWGADLRPANIGTSVPAYQRIADQYTYDSSGFPRYLVFNGTASGMYTPANLNLSATDKVTVFSGVRKLGSATNVLTEFSINASANNAFYVAAPLNTSDYSFKSCGLGGSAEAITAASYAAPITNVVSGIGDISGQIAQIRVNGSVAATNTGNQGTGNFGTYLLYIGSRANSLLFLNGYIYSLIVVGAASTAAQISSTESWINVKEGTVY